MSGDAGDRMRQYWDREIDHWARTSYDPAQARGLVPRIMARLRSSVDARGRIASQLLAPRIKGRTLLDLGCGDGRFALAMLDAGAARVEGWDIAPAAVEIARKRAAERGVADRADFHARSVDDADLPATEFTTGLGLLDWMPPEAIRRLLGRVRGRRVMFSYSEQDGTFAELVHRVWLCKRLEYFGGGVRAYHHPRAVMLEWFREAGFEKPAIVAHPDARFGRLIHNLDD